MSKNSDPLGLRTASFQLDATKTSAFPRSETGNVTLNAAHTPGPWRIMDSHDKRQAGYIRREGAPIGEMAVARVMQGRKWEEQTANARLIAAAPALYAALGLVLDNCDTCWDMGDNGRIPCDRKGHTEARTAIALVEVQQ